MFKYKIEFESGFINGTGFLALQSDDFIDVSAARCGAGVVGVVKSETRAE